jgi:ribosomal protein S18 acetylase RimI-like enzyme
MLASDRLSIRSFRAGDEDFIAALAHDAFHEYTPYAVPHTLGMVRRCTTFVALRELGPLRQLGPRERRVGFAAIADDGDGVILLNAIAVARSERGRGVGHYLMLAFERFARAHRGRRLELCTADYNLAALDLFMRHGFRIVRRRERFYDRGQDACILVKELR